MTQSLRSLATGVGLIILGAGSGVHAQPKPSALTPADAKVVADFQVRVAEYAALHNKIARTLKPLPKDASPQQFDTAQRLLFQGIVAARAGAKAGDIFTPESQAYLRRLLTVLFAGAEGAQRRASILDENPVGTPVRINAPYPDAIPLSTMPPQVIEMLPKLPEQLEFRFVGDRLILFDHHAHLMVDYVDHALPKG